MSKYKNRIKFGISKREIRRRAVKSSPFSNYLMEKYGTTQIPGEEYVKERKLWREISPNDKLKYAVIRKDGTINLKYAKVEVRPIGEAALAY